MNSPINKDPFFVIGDSHVGSFLVGAREAGGRDLVTGGGWGAASAYFEPFFDVVEERIVPYEDRVHYKRWKQATGVDLNDCQGRVIISMGLAAIPAMGRPVWRNFGPGRAPISRTLIHAIVDDLQIHVVRLYELLIERGLLAAVYDAPPPSAHHPTFKRAPKEILELVAERYRAPVLERIQRANLPIIRLPVVGDDGFIDPKYAGSDPAHASPAIGPHVVNALKALKKAH